MGQSVRCRSSTFPLLCCREMRKPILSGGNACGFGFLESPAMASLGMTTAMNCKSSSSCQSETDNGAQAISAAAAAHCRSTAAQQKCRADAEHSAAASPAGSGLCCIGRVACTLCS
jgi:hypothetical protein